MFLELLLALGESDAHLLGFGAHLRLRLQLLLHDLLLLGQLRRATFDVLYHSLGHLRFFRQSP